MVSDDRGAAAQDALMAQILASRAFSRIPPENLKKIVARIEVLPVSAGETIIRQGEVGDSFYIVREGTCRVVNYTSVEDSTMEIATLGPGESFGEEALIRDAPRNATVEMTHDGSLARLRKEDFITLIQQPLLQGLSPASVQEKVKQGAVVMDVRSSADYGKYAIPGSRSVPLDFLRQARRGLDRDVSYVACSDSALESALAAFVLAQKGFDASYLTASIAEYLRATGEYDEDSVDLPGIAEEIVIELPEEYAHMEAASVLVEGRGSDLAQRPAPAPKPAATPVDQIAQLREELRRALTDQREQHRKEIHALAARVQQHLDARSKALLQEVRNSHAELERKLAALSKK